MTPVQAAAIGSFFKAVAELEACGVFRSSRYLGDIGEFICQAAFPEIKLVAQLRQRGHDAFHGEDRVQIKFNNSTEGNNINVGNPGNYEVLIVVLGPRSKLREAGHREGEFRLYWYTSAEVQAWARESGNFYCARERLASCGSKKVVQTA